MPKKMIYVRDADVTFWDRAEAEARGHGIALSALIGRLLRAHVYRLGSKQEVSRTSEDLLAEAGTLIEQALKQMAAETGADEEEVLS